MDIHWIHYTSPLRLWFSSTLLVDTHHLSFDLVAVTHDYDDPLTHLIVMIRFK